LFNFFVESQPTSLIEPESQEITTAPLSSSRKTSTLAAIPVLPTLEPSTSVEPKGRLKMILNLL